MPVLEVAIDAKFISCLEFELVIGSSRFKLITVKECSVFLEGLLLIGIKILL